MDTANIKSGNAIFIAKDAVDNAMQPPIIRRALLEKNTDEERRIGEKAEQQKLVAGNEEVFQRAASFKQATRYDDTSNHRIRQELALYKSIDSQQKRDDIAMLLGVDIYA